MHCFSLLQSVRSANSDCLHNRFGHLVCWASERTRSTFGRLARAKKLKINSRCTKEDRNGWRCRGMSLFELNARSAAIESRELPGWHLDRVRQSVDCLQTNQKFWSLFVSFPFSFQFARLILLACLIQPGALQIRAPKKNFFGRIKIHRKSARLESVSGVCKSEDNRFLERVSETVSLSFCRSLAKSRALRSLRTELASLYSCRFSRRSPLIWLNLLIVCVCVRIVVFLPSDLFIKFSFVLQICLLRSYIAAAAAAI